jgi:hypothetical protein
MADTAVDVGYDRSIVDAVKNKPIHFYLFLQVFRFGIVTFAHVSPR